MTKPILVPFCKTRSGKSIQIGPASEWDRIRVGYEDQDYIDIYCVLERLEVDQHRDIDFRPLMQRDLGPLHVTVKNHFSSHSDLTQMLPPALERARIAQELMSSPQT